MPPNSSSARPHWSASASSAGESSAGWGRVLEHEKGFRALHMRPLALSPIFPIDLKLLKDMAAAYEIPLLMNVGEVRRAFPPLTTGA